MTLTVAVTLVGAVLAGAIDGRTGLIPNAVTRTASCLSLVLACAAGQAPAAFSGAMVTGGALFALYLGTRGRGLGFGDVKLGTAIGVGLGPVWGIAALGAAFIGGGLYGAWLLVRRLAARRDTVRFGPFLAVGTVVAALLAGDPR